MTLKMKRLITILLVVATAVSTLSSCSTNAEEQKAKYIFLFIGDGMGNSHVAAAESYLSYRNGKLGGEQLTFTGFPYLGLCTTYSANHNITCSSAAGTAIACGEKTNNGMLGVDPEGAPVESMAYILKEDGYKIGIMSSVPINHATPASFYAHSNDRGDYYNISVQIPSTGFDFFGGPGFISFNGKDGQEEDTDIYLEKNGYHVCYGKNELLAAADCTKVVFCQESNRKSSADNYVSDGGEAKDESLASIVEMAINRFGDKEPFFIMCEGGAIDWSAHDNKTMSMISEVIDFDAAVKVAYEFYLQHPDETLIVVTADHETGGIALGSRKGGSSVNWARLEEYWNDESKKASLDRESNMELNETCSVGWTTYGHTGAPVPTYAIGKGAEKFCGRLDNTDIKGKILGE